MENSYASLSLNKPTQKRRARCAGVLCWLGARNKHGESLLANECLARAMGAVEVDYKEVRLI